MTREQCAQLGAALLEFVAKNHSDAWFAVPNWFEGNPTPGGDLNIWERDGEVLAAVYPLRTNAQGVVETATNADPVWIFPREGWRYMSDSARYYRAEDRAILRRLRAKCGEVAG